MVRMVLSMFPGIGLLDRGFEDEGFCVVRGPDLLWGGDVRKFVPPRFSFDGVIGGPPCPDWSGARRAPRVFDGDGAAMIAEYVRVVQAVSPGWWLMENVDGVPDVVIPGFGWQRTDVEGAWYSRVRRLRHFQFGSRSRVPFEIPRGVVQPNAVPCALACDSRSVDELRALQGLPDDFELPGMTVEAQKRAIGNGVPYAMARTVARAVRAALEGQPVIEGMLFAGAPDRRCACSCGRVVVGGALYASAACRKRQQRRRDSACVAAVTGSGVLL